MWRWIAKLFGARNMPGSATAQRAREAAERRRLQASRMWPETRQVHDQLAELIENALRGHR